METITLPAGFLAPVDSHLGKWQIESGRLDHDAWMRSEMSKIIKPGWNILDAGAFNGDHSIFYREFAGERGAVVSVEANPEVFKLLRFNMTNQDFLWKALERYDYASSVCINACLFDDLDQTDGVSMCVNSDQEKNLGAHYVNTGMIGTIPVVTIEHIERLLGMVFDFIKMDIEGCELDALIGMPEHRKPVMVLEVNESALERQDSSRKDLLDELRDRGYTWRILQPELNVNSPQYDILCTPNP